MLIMKVERYYSKIWKKWSWIELFMVVLSNLFSNWDLKTRRGGGTGILNFSYNLKKWKKWSDMLILTDWRTLSFDYRLIFLIESFQTPPPTPHYVKNSKKLKNWIGVSIVTNFSSLIMNVHLFFGSAPSSSVPF